MKRHILLIALLALLQGCATTPPAQPAFVAKPPDLTPVDATGTYVHEPSRAMVPAEYASFRRVSLFKRGADGQRLTASFAGGGPECLTAITLFLDPAEEADGIEKAYANAKAEVTHAYPSAVLDHEDGRDDPALKGKRAFFRIDEKNLEVGVSKRGAWDVKHRVIYPAHCAEQVRPAVNAFFPGWQR